MGKPTKWKISAAGRGVLKLRRIKLLFYFWISFPNSNELNLVCLKEKKGKKKSHSVERPKHKISTVSMFLSLSMFIPT